MKSSIKILLACFFGSVFCVYILYLFSPLAKIKKNGFQRAFIGSTPPIVRLINLGYNSFYIAGVRDGNIYLGNPTAPGLLLKVNQQSSSIDTFHIDLPPGANPSWPSVRLSIDYPSVFVLDGTTSFIYKGFITNKSIDRWQKIECRNFTKSILTSSGYCLMRIKDTALNLNTLATDFNLNTHQYEKKYALKRQFDGVLCTDGILLYSADSGYVIYVYYYRNQILCFDVRLNLLYEARTIDTNTIAKIKLDTSRPNYMVTFSSPPVQVNEKAGVSKKNIYIHSGLKSDNEITNHFSNNSPIDVYDITNGHYLYSFYLPHYKHKSERDLDVDGNFIYALYDDNLLVYSLI